MSPPKSPQPKRAWVARAFTAVEDIAYVGLGLLLTGSSLVLLVGGMISFGQSLMAGTLETNIVSLLDRILLVLLLVELLYTVQVSFREHTIVPEPFLVVGLIAAIRRVLVLTAEFPEIQNRPAVILQSLILELVVLTLLIIALVVSLFLLRKMGTTASAERAN